jgi:hypothetical protein
MTTTVDTTNTVPLAFALTPIMTYEDSIKKMYSKTGGSVHPSKMTMQVMIVITVTSNALPI